jgi:hypothetical protein
MHPCGNMPHSDAVPQYRDAVTQYRHAVTQYEIIPILFVIFHDFCLFCSSIYDIERPSFYGRLRLTVLRYGIA